MRILIPGLGTSLVLWAVLLVAGAVFLDAATFESVFVEDRPVEDVSAALWVGLVLAVLAWRSRLSTVTLLTGVALALAAAARESDWNKLFTSGSMSKLHYYTDSGVPFLERAVAAAVVSLLAVVIVFALAHAIRRLRDGGWRRPGGQPVIIGIGLLVFTKVLDRAPAVFRESFGFEFALQTQRVMLALEEGLEMALPLVFLSAAYHAARRLLPTEGRFVPASAREESLIRVPPSARTTAITRYR